MSIYEFLSPYHDNAELLEEILTKHPEVDFVQLQINYLDWNSEGIQSGKCYDVATKRGVKIFKYCSNGTNKGWYSF